MEEPSTSSSGQGMAASGDNEAASSSKFHVDMDLIPTANLNDETDDLQALGIDVFNQEDLEQGLMHQVDAAVAKEEEKKKKEQLKKDVKKLNDDIRAMKHELASLATQLAQLGHGKAVSTGGANRRLVSALKQKETKVSQLKELEEKKKKLQARLDGKLPLFDENEIALKKMLASSGNETKDQMIKTGEMTPFGTVVKQEQPGSSVEGIDEQQASVSHRPTSVFRREVTQASRDIKDEQLLSEGEIHSEGEEWLPSKRDHQISESDDECVADVKQEENMDRGKKRKKKAQKGWSKKYNRPLYRSNSEDSDSDDGSKLPRAKPVKRHRDDGHEEFYLERIEKFNETELSKQRLREAGRLSDSEDDEEFDSGIKVPGRIWSKLYKYQKTCVKWLWELHCQQAGGIIGDEMGLGKTIQAIAFLAAMQYSKQRSSNFSYLGLGPTLIVCPATVMHQWVKEFHTWWPVFRVAVLHSSGTHIGKDTELIRQIARRNGILITSYNTLVLQQEALLGHNWHYVILDEGHKIRNPDVQATLVCKQFRTPHRIILSGSPIQNNLKELWSLMDFVFPGKLGTLPDFMQHFAVPIVQGGYSNATDVQVETAYKCACVLRDTINPYLLRRMKADVKMAVNLPAKNEQVLFCRLTQDQRGVYEEYLASRECQEILRGRLMVFSGLIQLRKICNHPDLATGGPRLFKGDQCDANDHTLDYGYWKRAGKMIVVDALLKLWKKQGHKALLFTQSRQMLDIMETYVQEKGYRYVRMDGGTGISARQPLVERYNRDDSIYLFLLTTRVGGLGINLTGANRIIIYDPDWNPSTDMQARERSWRIGQKRQVTIYRLLTTGSIEEKIYHRQIFKQFLTNRVLKDPKQRRLFKTNDLYELFSLGLSDDKGETETAAIFAGTGSDVSVKPTYKNSFDRIKEERRKKEQEKEAENSDDVEKNTQADLNFDPEEITKMREMARKLSQKMGQNKVMKTAISADSKPGSSDSGSDSRVKDSSQSATSGTGANTTTSVSHGNTSSKVVSQDKDGTKKDAQNAYHTDNISHSDKVVSQGKYGTVSADGNSLKHFRIKKKPSSATLETHEKDKVFVCSSEVKASSNKDKNKIKTGSSNEKSDHKNTSLKFTSSDSGKKVSSGTRTSSTENVERKQRHKKKKKHKKKDAKYDGERIPHLDKVRSFKRPSEADDKTTTVSEQESEAMDNYVLKTLFKKTDIQGALRHDTIMEPGKPDYVIIESEATKVAKEASHALKKSRQHCLPAIAGVPTWTGQHGAKRPRFGQKKNTLLAKTQVDKGAPSTAKDSAEKEKSQDAKQHFDGSLAGSVQTNLETGANVTSAVHSTDLLNKMRVRNEVFSKEDGGDEENEEIFVSDADSLELIKRLREFILFECTHFGQATTKELLDEFGDKLPKENSAKFRALLHSICDFQKSDMTGRVGVWKLRQDFK